MRYLINLCSYDGIIGHYCGVGSIVIGYVEAIKKIADQSSSEISLNLLAINANPNTLRYLASQETESVKQTASLNGHVFTVDNGNHGTDSFGKESNWMIACKNTAEIINNLDTSNYDKVINIYNDSPYAQLATFLKPDPKFFNVFIPHSSAVLHDKYFAKTITNKTRYKIRKTWEQAGIDFINSHANNFVGEIGKEFGEHFVKNYKLAPTKVIKLHNGIIIDNRKVKPEPVLDRYLNEIPRDKPLILSYARAESYKGLDYTLRLGNYLSEQATTILIAQAYYKGQPIIHEYELLARGHNVKLWVDPPFLLPKYILQTFDQKIIVLVPSKREAMGMVVNEVRGINRANVIAVANNIAGLREQIQDGQDGILIDSINKGLKSNAKIISDTIGTDWTKLNQRAYLRLRKDYDILANFRGFLNNLTGEKL